MILGVSWQDLCNFTVSMFLVQDGFIIPGAGECPNGHPPTFTLFQTLGTITVTPAAEWQLLMTIWFLISLLPCKLCIAKETKVIKNNIFGKAASVQSRSWTRQVIIEWWGQSSPWGLFNLHSWISAHPYLEGVFFTICLQWKGWKGKVW